MKNADVLKLSSFGFALEVSAKLKDESFKTSAFFIIGRLEELQRKRKAKR